MKIVKNLVPKSKYNIKCPYAMAPTRIVVHNTANDASAKNEIAYMVRNNNYVSFHYAVDDKEVVQGVEENRNAWHAGDGENGVGNRKGIAIEICYSKSGGAKFTKAEQNAVELIVDILKRYEWGIEKVTKHQDYSGKYCPHRTLDNGWDRFINMIKNRLNEQNSPDIEQMARDCIAGKYGNGNARKKALGIHYAEVQAKVNEILSGKTTVVKQKSVEAIAKEVIAGKWGNGQARKDKLTKAGYNYAEVQAKVNELLG